MIKEVTFFWLLFLNPCNKDIILPFLELFQHASAVKKLVFFLEFRIPLW